VPGTHSSAYAGTGRVRQGIHGVTNPISVPGILAAPGLALENWSGSESAAAPWLERLVALAGRPEAEVVAAFGLDGGGDPAFTRRALLLDLRNLGTLGLQQDSFPGLLWADALAGRATLPPAALAAIPPLYAARAVRAVLARESAALTRPARDPAAVARGRALFTERVVGTIANRQILKEAPPAYAAAKLEGPVLAPIDPTRPLEAKLDVRCADCHNGSPLERTLPLAENPPPLGRCTHCHATHEQDGAVVAVRAMGIPAAAAAEVAACARCHKTHRAFGPLVYSGSRLFPFDADGDGDAQGDERADARAGGIGTDPLLAFDVPRPQRPFSLEVPVVSDAARPGRVGRARTGVSWVRAAPLVAVFATAPYLHDGSVPTLRALLEPPRRRPVAFPLGPAGFVFDTRLPGNHNGGHEFGMALTAADKDDLIAFLETL
jgi:hypothetical protein